jgi:hypothetical protein
MRANQMGVIVKYRAWLVGYLEDGVTATNQMEDIVKYRA